MNLAPPGALIVNVLPSFDVPQIVALEMALEQPVTLFEIRMVAPYTPAVEVKPVRDMLPPLKTALFTFTNRAAIPASDQVIEYLSGEFKGDV